MKETVPVMTFSKLIETYGVCGINFLKIDTEGHDITILEGMIEYCENHTDVYPKKIKFESNTLVNALLVDEVIEKLERCGYVLEVRGHDTIMNR